ncbi:MAG: type 1 glutamine amidotransferase domain-containing protein [Patescibacteria group bacterium]
MKLTNKKIAVFIENQYQELEVWYPYLRLKEEGAQVFFVGPEKGKVYTSKYGYAVTAELEIAEVNAQDFDAVVVPGGYAPDYMRRNAQMVQFLRDMNAAQKPVAAICHAGWMLASAEIIAGKKVTSVSAIQDDMRHAGGHWVDEEVVRDGNIITSRKPEDLPAFCRTIIEILSSFT